MSAGPRGFAPSLAQALEESMKRWMVKASAVLAMVAGVAVVGLEVRGLLRGEIGGWFWILVGVGAFAFGLAELLLGKPGEEPSD